MRGSTTPPAAAAAIAVPPDLAADIPVGAAVPVAKSRTAAVTTNTAAVNTNAAEQHCCLALLQQ
jgi:hypothetical protein